MSLIIEEKKVKLRNNVFVLCALVIFVREASAMFCLGKPIGSVQLYKKAASTHIGNDFYSQIEAIGLKKCVKAYSTKKRCSNKLCCKSVFTGIHTIKGLKKAQLKKNKFLQQIDASEGRLNFLIRLQKACNDLSRIEKEVAGNCDESELWHLINHQKTCLWNQLRVIQEDTPSLDVTAEVTFNFNEEGVLVMDIDLFLETRGDKE